MTDQVETYVSTDIETDGPIPGENSMLSFASAAYATDGKEIATFSANLESLPGAKPNARTMEWWKSQPEAWAACRRDRQPIEPAIRRYVEWLDGLPGRPVFVAYPLLFDMMFVYWYLIRFVGRSPFSHSGIDIKTMAWAALGLGHYREASKRNMPREWFSGIERHTHVALDDAREQGRLFFRIRRALNAPAPTPAAPNAPKFEIRRRPPTRTPST
jgi:DNA polymerase III alpha subunit (gram-positive type)